MTKNLFFKAILYYFIKHTKTATTKKNVGKEFQNEKQIIIKTLYGVLNTLKHTYIDT